MLIELAFKKGKKTYQSLLNGLLNLGNKFCHNLQNAWIWIFILQCVSFMCLEL